MKKIFILLLILILISEIHAIDKGEMKYKDVSFYMDYDEIRLSNEEKVMPIYTELKYHFPVKNKYTSFIKSEIGFNFVEEDENSEEVEGLFQNNYYGIGAGINVKGLMMELMYASYNVAYEKGYASISEDRILFKVEYKY